MISQSSWAQSKLNNPTPLVGEDARRMRRAALRLLLLSYALWPFLTSIDTSIGNHHDASPDSVVGSFPLVSAGTSRNASAPVPATTVGQTIDIRSDKDVKVSPARAVPIPQRSRLLLPPVNHSAALPPWMQDYFEWHHQQRMALTIDNWKSKRFLVLRCLDTDGPCGGLADRCTYYTQLLAFQQANISS